MNLGNADCSYHIVGLFKVLLKRTSFSNASEVNGYFWVATRENLCSGFPTRSETNRAVQPKQRVKGLKSRI